MPALTFDDLLQDAPAPTPATGYRSSRVLTFDDLLEPEGAKPAPDPRLPQSNPVPQTMLERAADVGRSVLSGLDVGAGMIAGGPADAISAASSGLDYLKSKVTGRPYQEIVAESARNSYPSPETLERWGSAAAHANSPARYDSPTALGRGAETVASFVPGALTGGTGLVRNVAAGAPGALATLAKYAGATVAAPAAGQLTARGANSVLGIQGTPAALIEGGAALAGGGLGAFANRAGRAENAIRQAAGDLDPQVYQQAQGLMDDAARMGVRLTADEAIQQVTNNGTRLGELRRVVESSAGGGNVLKPMMAERPGQVRAAGEAATDALGAGMDPTQTGLRINRAAAGEIGDTQAAINATTRPLYQQAEGQRVDPQVLAAIMDDPLYARTFDEVRNNPALNRTIANLPDDSVGVIDLVQRRMREAAENARVPGQAGSGNLIAANLDDARTAPIAAAERATGGPQGSYSTARAEQARLRHAELEPLTAGPVGRLAGSEDAAAQAAALLPSAPKVSGAEAGIADAVRRVAIRDPQATQSLIRGHVRSAFDEATQNLATGENQFGGAKFASIVAGNGQQAANLEAAIRALPNGDNRWQGFRRFLDVMEATGKRQGAGSNTSADTITRKELMQGGLAGEAVAAVKTGGLSFVKRFNEFRDQMNLGTNTGQIANLLTRPDAARLLGQLASAPPNSSRAQILAFRLSYMGRTGEETGLDRRLGTGTGAGGASAYGAGQ